MPTPNRESIITNVVTTLQGITVAGGFKTDVVQVERVAKNWADVGNGARPWLGVLVGKERYTHQPFGEMDVFLTVHIIGHVASTSDEDRSTKLNALMDDVIAALQADTTRGGYAVQTT